VHYRVSIMCRVSSCLTSQWLACHFARHARLRSEHWRLLISVLSALTINYPVGHRPPALSTSRRTASSTCHAITRPIIPSTTKTTTAMRPNRRGVQVHAQRRYTSTSLVYLVSWYVFILKIGSTLKTADVVGNITIYRKQPRCWHFLLLILYL